MRRSWLLFTVVFIALGFESLYGQAPVCHSLTSGNLTYAQDFNTLAITGTSSIVPGGFGFVEAGTNMNTTYGANNGGSSTGNTYSYGTDGSTERAFGGLQSSSLIPTVGGCFTNSTGSTISAFQITYDGEQWRLGALARLDKLDFQYSTDATSLATGTWIDVDALDFIAPNTTTAGGILDGNASGNRMAGINATISSLTIANGATFYIRYNSFDAVNSDDGLAVDNFSLTATLADTTPPDTSFLTTEPNPTNDATGDFTFSSTEPGTFECSVDGGAFAACTTPFATASLADGAHTLAVRAIDATTNVDPTPASYMWTVDTAAPAITYTPLPNTTSTANPTLSAAGTDAVGVTGATIFWSVNGGTFGSNPCALSGGTAQNGTWDCTITGTLTNPSTIAYYVTAQDGAATMVSNPAAGMAAPNLYTIGAASVPTGTYTNLSASNGATLGGNVRVTNVLTLGGIVNTGANTLTLGCAAAVANAGTANYVVGNLAKDYCTTGAFTYPVGTSAGGMNPGDPQPFGAATEYTPVAVNVTALGVVPSTLSVEAFDNTLSGFSPATSLSRNWRLNETGDLTADLLFTYLDPGDVNGNEADYRVYSRDESGITTNHCPGAPCVDTLNNTAGPVTGVTTFSRWTAGQLQAPTAADVSLSGRITDTNGRGIRNTRVVISGGNLDEPRIALTGSFGYFVFDGLRVGETYVVSVSGKRYTFVNATRVVTLNDEIADVDFTAQPR